MTKFVNDLRSDKCVLGKMPDLGDEEVEKIFDNFDKNDDGKITWIEFRDKMATIPWTYQDKDDMEARIEDYFKEAGRAKIKGDMETA